MNAITTIAESAAAIVERVIINGDLSKLTPDQRVQYYRSLCESVGLNALTQPFAYITLNGKLTLYALKGCTDQLRSLHKISVESLEKTTVDGIYVVTAKVKNGDGRTDVDDGAVNIASLKGENLANAMMKAATKAKRRATLSICGLGMLDETEVETIPGAALGEPERLPKPKAESREEKGTRLDAARTWANGAMHTIQGLDEAEREAWMAAPENAERLVKLRAIDPDTHVQIIKALQG